MSVISSLTPAQLADRAARERDGQPLITEMSSAERRENGLMTIGEAARHERLRSQYHPRLAERVHGPVDDDPWALPGGESDG